MNRDLLSVGEMLIDFLPGTEEDSYIKRAGGAPANAAVAAARQGLTAAMTCMLGNDDFGRFLQKTLVENGVTPTNPELTDLATTTMAFVSLDEHGDRSFTFARKPGADMLLEKRHIDEAGIEETALVHGGSCSLSGGPEAEATVYALQKAHDLGALVSFDVNYRNLMWNDDIEKARAAVRAVLPFVDLLKISDEEADFLGGEAHIPEAMKEYKIALVVETLGAEGAVWFYDGKSERIPGIPSDCVDTCGAGDAFWGSVLASLLKAGVRKTADLTEEKIRNAVRHGHVAGALCVRKKGAIESLPDEEACERFYREYYG